jgi:hypothetical protein
VSFGRSFPASLQSIFVVLWPAIMGQVRFYQRQKMCVVAFGCLAMPLPGQLGSPSLCSIHHTPTFHWSSRGHGSGNSSGGSDGNGTRARVVSIAIPIRSPRTWQYPATGPGNNRCSTCNSAPHNPTTKRQTLCPRVDTAAWCR